MSKRIIIVDDDREICEIVTFALNRHDFDVVAAFNGQQLCDLLTVQLPDVIILDVMLPDEDGYQLCANIRNNPNTQHIPVIIITAHVERIYERISLDLGAAVHIIKPFHPLQLVENVKALL